MARTAPEVQGSCPSAAIRPAPNSEYSYVQKLGGVKGWNIREGGNPCLLSQRIHQHFTRISRLCSKKHAKYPPENEMILVSPGPYMLDNQSRSTGLRNAICEYCRAQTIEQPLAHGVVARHLTGDKASPRQDRADLTGWKLWIVLLTQGWRVWRALFETFPGRTQLRF